MKDYKVLTDRSIYRIVYKTIRRIAPSCVDNREGMTKEQKNYFIKLIMKKINVNEKQAIFLMEAKNGNYRKRLLEIEGIQEPKSFNNIINYLEISNHNIPFIIFLLLLLLLVLIIIEIALIINKEVFLSAIFGTLILLVFTFVIFFVIKLLPKKYENLSNDRLVEEQINIKQIRLEIISEMSNHPPHIVWVKGLRIIGFDSNDKKIILTYPLDIMIHDKFYFSVRRKFNKEIKSYYEKCTFDFLQKSGFVLDSNKNFNHIIKRILEA